MPATPQIRLLSGFETLPFGANPAKAKDLFGAPDEESTLEDEVFNQPKLLWHYHTTALSLFFDYSGEKHFFSAECKHPDTLLFGEKVIGMNEKTLMDLLKKYNYPLSEREVLPWGETCLNFDEAGLECYFKNKKLIALVISAKRD